MRKKSYPLPDYRALLPARDNKRSGFKEEAIELISNAQMRVADKVFWNKRGFSEPPGATINMNLDLLRATSCARDVPGQMTLLYDNNQSTQTHS